MFPKVASRLAITGKSINKAFACNIGSSSVLLQKADPIQELFLNKVREYYQKKRYLKFRRRKIWRIFKNFIFNSASKTGLVDSSPETQKALKDEIEKINKQFGTSATAEFPSFTFSGKKN